MRRIYILDIEELKASVLSSARQEDLSAGLIAKRREKLMQCRREQDRLRSLGAGLLLQYGLWQLLRENPDAADSSLSNSGQSGSCLSGGSKGGSWEAVAADHFLEEAFQSTGCLGREAISCLEQLSFKEGDWGKPYIEGAALHFNLSHSGRLAACGISDRAIGVDIQEKRPGDHRRLWERFFTEEEKKLLKRCDSKEEEEELFYRFWTAKEAYGKLTGRGLAAGGMQEKRTALQISPWLERDRLKIGCLEYRGYECYQGMACYYQSEGDFLNEETNDLFEGL